MSIVTVFKIVNNIALVGWLLLLILPKWKYTIPVAISSIVFILCLSYFFLITASLSYIKTDVFNSLSTIRSLFNHDIVLLAGWVHYLAFDLFVGAYIVREAEKIKLHRLAVAILLPFTFLFAPIGYVCFQVIKTIKGWKRQ